MALNYRAMTIDDYGKVYELWTHTEGVGLSSADERASIAIYLARNPGMSFVVFEDEALVGAVLCGHDGRRGLIHHLAVSDTHRRRGIGGGLVDRCLAALAEGGIQKCHLFVFAQNMKAQEFWLAGEWFYREELRIMSHFVPSSNPA